MQTEPKPGETNVDTPTDDAADPAPAGLMDLADGADADDAGGSDEADDEPAGTVPDSAEAYELPTIEGLDPEQLKTSPIVESMREAAFKAGMNQEDFSAAIADYGERATTKLKENTAREIAALGENAKQRISALNSTLGQRLPADLAQALATSITSAKAVQAIEKLLATGRKTTGSQPQPKPTKDRAEIEKMMADIKYRGNPQQRDAGFIKEIDDWWRAQAEAKK